jgi:hypothetical protein
MHYLSCSLDLFQTLCLHFVAIVLLTWETASAIRIVFYVASSIGKTGGRVEQWIGWIHEQIELSFVT